MKNSVFTSSLTVMITPEARGALDCVAARQETNIATVLRRAVRELLEREDQTAMAGL
jgi:hypothetical protein